MDGNTRNIHKYTLYTRLQHFPQPSALKRIFHAYSTLVARIEAIKKGKARLSLFFLFFTDYLLLTWEAFSLFTSHLFIILY